MLTPLDLALPVEPAAPMHLRAISVVGAGGLNVLVCGYDDGTLILRDVESYLAPQATLKKADLTIGHAAAVRCITTISEDMFASTSDDGTIYIWQLVLAPPEEEPPLAAAGAFGGGVGGK